MGVPLIEQVKIQARVLVPLVRTLHAELGEERANALVRKSLGAPTKAGPAGSAYNSVISIHRSKAMIDLEQLEKHIERLSPEELKKFRAWFAEFDARAWDAEIEADSRAGKLDSLVAEARAEHKAGKTREL
jgi:hypothetical protein